jgi:predicted amino acid-binding ACT domain protein
MTALAFDTLKFAQTLRDKAKFTQEQSEGLALAISDTTSNQLATKENLNQVERDIRSDIRQLDLSVKADISAIKSELKTEITTLRSALNTEIATLRSELNTEITALKSELNTEITTLRSELKTETTSLRSEIKASEGRLEVKIETLRSDVLKWIVSSIGFQTIVILGALMTLSRMLSHN